MGVYSINSGIETNFDTDMITESSYTPDIAGAYAIVAENEANYNRIMKSVGIAELACLESTGVEMIYEAGDIKSFFGKIKQFFLSIIEKVKSLVKKFFALIDSYTKSDKDFVDKYKKTLYNIKTTDFEYEGYEFSNLDWSPSAAAKRMQDKIEKDLGYSTADFASVVKVADATNMDTDEFDKIVKNYEDAEDIREAMRGAAIKSGDSKLEASEFAGEIFKYFRSDEDSKQTIDNVNVNDLLSWIYNTADAKKKAQNVYNEIEKTIKKDISDLEKAEKAIEKLVPGNSDTDTNLTSYRTKALQACNKVINMTKDKLNFLQQVNGGLLTAIKDRNRQAKSVCVKLLTYKPKNESAGVGSYSEGGFLSGVILK